MYLDFLKPTASEVLDCDLQVDNKNNDKHAIKVVKNLFCYILYIAVFLHLKMLG